MSDAALEADRHSDQPHRHARRIGVDPVATTQRWAVGVLVVSTLALLAYVALLVVANWLFAVGSNAVTAGGSASVDVLAIGAGAALLALTGLL